MSFLRKPISVVVMALVLAACLVAAMLGVIRNFQRVNELAVRSALAVAADTGGLEIKVASIHGNFLGHVILNGVEVRPVGRREPWLKVKQARARYSLRSLWDKSRPVALQLELERPSLGLKRLADGRFAGADLLQKLQRRKGAGRALALVVRFKHAQIQFSDESDGAGRKPLQLGLEDVSGDFSLQPEGGYALQVKQARLARGGRFSGRCTGDVRTGGVQLGLEAFDLPFDEFWRYLPLPKGLRVAGGRISGRGSLAWAKGTAAVFSANFSLGRAKATYTPLGLTGSLSARGYAGSSGVKFDRLEFAAPEAAGLARLAFTWRNGFSLKGTLDLQRAAPGWLLATLKRNVQLPEALALKAETPLQGRGEFAFEKGRFSAVLKAGLPALAASWQGVGTAGVDSAEATCWLKWAPGTPPEGQVALPQLRLRAGALKFAPRFELAPGSTFEGKLVFSLGKGDSNLRLAGRIRHVQTEFGQVTEATTSADWDAQHWKVNVQTAKASVFGGALSAQGTFIGDAGGEYQGQGTFEVQGVNLAQAGEKYWPEGRLAGAVTGKGTFTLHPGEWRVEALASAPELQVEDAKLSRLTLLGTADKQGFKLAALDCNFNQAQLTAKGACSWEGDFSAEAFVDSLALADLAGPVEAAGGKFPALQGLCKLQVKASGNLHDLRKVEAVGKLVCLHLKSGNLALDGVASDFTLRDGSLELKSGSVFKGLSELDLKGKVHDLFEGLESARLELELESPSLSIQSLLQSAGLESRAVPDISGVLKLKGKVGGVLSRPVGEASLELAGFQAYGELFRSAVVQVEFSPAEITLQQAELEAVGGGKLSFAGSLYYPLDEFATPDFEFQVSNFALEGLNLAQVRGYALSGLLQAEGRLSGTLKEPELEVAGTLVRPGLGSESLASLTWHGKWRPSEKVAEVTTLEANLGGDQVIAGQCKLDYGSDGIAGSGHFEHVQKAGLERAYKLLQEGLKGQVASLPLPQQLALEAEGYFALSGKLSDPQVKVQVKQLAGALGDRLLPPVRAVLQRRAGGLVEVTLHSKEGKTVAGAALFTPNGGLTGDLTLEALDLKLVQALTNVGLAGRVDCQVGFSGSLEAPVVKLSAQAEQPEIMGVQLDRLSLQNLLLTKDKLVIGALHTTLAGGKATFSGSVGFAWHKPYIAPDAPLKLQFALERQPLYPVLQRLRQQALYSGDISANFAITGTRAAPKVNGRFELVDGQALLGDFGALSQVSLKGAVEPVEQTHQRKDKGFPWHKFTLESASAKLGEGTFSASGTVELRHLGKDQLLENPLEFRLSGQRLWFPINSSPYVRQAHFALEATGAGKGEVTVKVLEAGGEMGSGTVRAGGYVKIAHLEPSKLWKNTVQLTSELKGAEVNVPPYGKASCSGKVSFSTELPGEPPVISGEVVVSDLRALLATRKKSEPKPWLFAGLHQAPSLSVDLQTGENVLLIGPRLEARLGKSTVHIGGTLDQPLISGQVQVASGRIIYPVSDINLKKGLVKLIEITPKSSGPGWDVLVNVDMYAETKLSSYLVTMHLYGPVNDMQVSLSSQPPLRQEQIYALLGGVQRVKDLFAGNFMPSLQEEVTSLLASEMQYRLFTGVESTLEQVFGLEEFRIRYDLEQNAEIRVGKEFFNRFHILYTRTISQSSLPTTESIRASYEVNPKITISFENSELNRHTTFVEFNTPF